ncbi:MAG: hypothetical protein SGJ11_11370 [Phycisphaerae bacterium]|nr:hypothetical protein [Phycisphaerae bacterium]
MQSETSSDLMVVNVKNFAEMHGHLARMLEAQIDKVAWSEALRAAVAQSSDPNAYRTSLESHARALSDSRSWLIDLLFHKFLLETAELWIRLGARLDMLNPAGCVDVVFEYGRHSLVGQGDQDQWCVARHVLDREGSSQRRSADVPAVVMRHASGAAPSRRAPLRRSPGRPVPRGAIGTHPREGMAQI